MSADYSSDEKSVNRDEGLCPWHCMHVEVPAYMLPFDFRLRSVHRDNRGSIVTLDPRRWGNRTAPEEESQVLRSKGHLLSSAAFVGDLEYPELWSFVDDVRDKQRRRWQRYGAPRLFAAAVSSARRKTDRAAAQRIARIRLLIAETRRKLIVAK